MGLLTLQGPRLCLDQDSGMAARAERWSGTLACEGQFPLMLAHLSDCSSLSLLPALDKLQEA